MPVPITELEVHRWCEGIYRPLMERLIAINTLAKEFQKDYVENIEPILATYTDPLDFVEDAPAREGRNRQTKQDIERNVVNLTAIEATLAAVARRMAQIEHAQVRALRSLL